MSVLVVEDEDLIRRSLVRVFQKMGVTVVDCASGEEAVRLWREKLPDMVILDYQLYGMNAPQVLTAVRETGIAIERSKVYVFSAYAEESIRQQFQTGEVCEFIKKPCEDIFGLVERLLKK